MNLVVVLIVSTKLMSRGVFVAAIVALALVALRSLVRAPLHASVRLVPLAALTLSAGYFILPHLQRSDLYYYLLLTRAEDPLNGRAQLWDILLTPRGALDFLFGSGIGSFYADSGGGSPHNVLGHVFYEMGIVLSIALGLWLIAVLRWTLRVSDRGDAIVLVTLFATSVTRLMFSYSFWLEPGLWLLIGVYLQSSVEARSERPRHLAVSPQSPRGQNALT